MISEEGRAAPGAAESESGRPLPLLPTFRIKSFSGPPSHSCKKGAAPQPRSGLLSVCPSCNGHFHEFLFLSRSLGYSSIVWSANESFLLTATLTSSFNGTESRERDLPNLIQARMRAQKPWTPSNRVITPSFHH